MKIHTEKDFENANRNNLRNKSNLINRLAIGGIIVGFSFLGYATIKTLTNNEKEQSKLYEQIFEAANTNGDNFTSHEEWAEVYNFLGKKYSIHYSNPKEDLTKENINNYLEGVRE